MKKGDERIRLLLESLKLRERLDTGEVATLLGVSESTARRLFSRLEKEGRIIRTFGGAQIVQEPNLEYSFKKFGRRNLAEKKRIAAAACDFVHSGDALYLDSGTTTFQLAATLAERIKKGSLSGVIAFTNSLANMNILTGVCRVIQVGGEYRPERRDFAGLAAERVVSSYSFARCFLGADGVDLEAGFMTTDEDTARLESLVLERADAKVFLVDSTKIARRSLVRICPLDGADLAITDDKLPMEVAASLETGGLRILRV